MKSTVRLGNPVAVASCDRTGDTNEDVAAAVVRVGTQVRDRRAGSGALCEAGLGKKEQRGQEGKFIVHDLKVMLPADPSASFATPVGGAFSRSAEPVRQPLARPGLYQR